MQINISGHHIEVTDALRDYVSEKLERLGRFSDDITSIQTILSIEKARHIAEATIRARGADLHATAESEDMYAAIDLLYDKLDRQVTKHKEKQKSW